MGDRRAPASGVAGRGADAPHDLLVSRERYSVRAFPGCSDRRLATSRSASRLRRPRPLARWLQLRHRAEEFERRIAASIGIALEQTRRSRLRPAPARRGARNRSEATVSAASNDSPRLPQLAQSSTQGRVLGCIDQEIGHRLRRCCQLRSARTAQVCARGSLAGAARFARRGWFVFAFTCGLTSVGAARSVRLHLWAKVRLSLATDWGRYVGSVC